MTNCIMIGACAGERDSYQRVNVDDGAPAVGALDHLVHQTIHSPPHFCHLRHHSSQGSRVIISLQLHSR